MIHDALAFTICGPRWLRSGAHQEDMKTVQALLRHSDVRTTLQLYAQPTGTKDRMAAQELALLGIPEDPTACKRSLDDRRFALDHFPQKLLKLGANFATATGQALAMTRVRALEEFYQGMLAELRMSDAIVC